jgi:hypothetical protein
MTTSIIRLLPFLVLSLPVSALAGDQGDQPLTLLPPPQSADKTALQQQTLQQSEELHDIHGPLPIAGQPPYPAIAGIILAILLILAVLYFWLKRRAKPGPPAPLPWETALSELAAAKPLQSAGQGLLYMERAGQVLRRYIESRFAIRSTRQTTREFLAGLSHGGNSSLDDYRPELQVCLEQADMAKFAHRVPDLDNMIQMEQAVTDFVQKTESIPAPSGGGS